MKPVPNWRKLHRAWSLRLGVIGTAITGVLVAFPEFALHIWSMLPSEFKTFIPEQYMPLAGVVLFALSMVAKFIKQPSLEDKPQ